MRHLKAGRRLGVTTSHRRAMMRNMVTSILEKGEIRCTLARAKEVRKPLEKMITLAKRGDLHARRQALSFVKSKEAMSQLFDELSERYSDRQGGYCRIIKLGQTRLGDNSEMAIVQLIGSENDQLSSLKSTSGKKKPARKSSSKVLEKVSEEVRQAEESSEKAAKDEAVEEQVDAPEKSEASEKTEASESATAAEAETPEQETSEEKTEEQQAKTETPEEEPVQETNQEETEASGKTSDPEPVEASAGTEQTDVSSEPEPDPAENKESKEEK